MVKLAAAVDLCGTAPIVGGTHRKLGGDGGSSEGRESETRGQVGEKWTGGRWGELVHQQGTARRGWAAAWVRPARRHGASAAGTVEGRERER